MSRIEDAAVPYALIASPTRIIGTIVPDVTVAEVHQDAVAITDHPVEVGATVSDHAFVLPERCEMRIGYSDSTAGYVGYSREQYDAILALMSKREPFSVFTAKRLYSSMLVETVVTETDGKTAYAAMIIVRLRKVNIVSTKGGGGSSVAPNSDQAEPQNTGSVSDNGTVQPVPADGAAGGELNPGNGLSSLPQGVSGDAALQPGTPASPSQSFPNIGDFGSGNGLQSGGGTPAPAAGGGGGGVAASLNGATATLAF